MSKKSSKKNARKCGKCGRTGHYKNTCEYKTKAPKAKSVPLPTNMLQQIVAEQVEEIVDKMYERLVEKFRMESGLILTEMRKIQKLTNPYGQVNKKKTCDKCKGTGKVSIYNDWHEKPHPQYPRSD